MPDNGEATNGPDEPDQPVPRGIHPAFIHAFRRCGFLLTEANAHTFSDKDVQRWNAAVAEGERIYGPVNPED
jgi:hypothetical protein